MELCSICLDNIEDKQLTYTLSCGHTFHWTCFKNYVYKTSHCFFIDCPLCRQLNYKVEFPFPDNFQKNLQVLCSSNVGKIKCPMTTLQGLKCKKKSHLFNYGLCTFHNNDILPKDKYETFCRYIYHILQCSNRTWETKVYLIDFAKKILIKYSDDVNTLEDIYKYLFIYIADAKKKEIDNCYKDKSILFNYYDLELPPDKWAQFCIDKRCLF